jgi:hypothetical protein
MNRDQLKELIRQPLWSKQVVVWMGERTALDPLLVGADQRELDILALIPDGDTWPRAKDERADWLRDRLDRELRALKSGIAGRTVLRVRNAALLARLGTGLRPFYDWFAGSDTMTVLEVDPVSPLVLPDTVANSVRLDPDWLADSFRPLLARPDYLCVQG